MTAANIQNALIVRLTDILKDFPLKLPYNSPTPFKIFKHKIPEKLASDIDYSKGKKDAQSEVYPFCLVKIDTGSKTANHDMEESVCNVVIGVENDGVEGEGYDDVLACIQAIWNDFNAKPLLDQRYQFAYPSSWVLDDGEANDTHPFYYGVLQLRFKAMSMRNGGNTHGEHIYKG